MMGRMIRKWSL